MAEEAKGVCCRCKIRKVLRAFSIIDIFLSLCGIVCFISLERTHFHYTIETMEDGKKIVPRYSSRDGVHADTNPYEEDIIDVCNDYIQKYSSQSLQAAFYAAVGGFWISLLGYLSLGIHLLFITLKPKRAHIIVNLTVQTFVTIILITSCVFFNLPMLCQLEHYRGMNERVPIDLQSCVNFLTGIMLFVYKVPEFLNVFSLLKHVTKGTLNQQQRRTIGAFNLYNYEVENRESQHEECEGDYHDKEHHITQQSKTILYHYQRKQPPIQTQQTTVQTIHLEQNPRRFPRRIDVLDV